MEKEKRYPVTYQVEFHDPGLTKEQIKADGRDLGACDGLLITSIIWPPDGSASYAQVSRDGRTGKDLSPEALFKIWAVMAADLAASPQLGTGARELCGEVHRAITAALLK